MLGLGNELITANTSIPYSNRVGRVEIIDDGLIIDQLHRFTETIETGFHDLMTMGWRGPS